MVVVRCQRVNDAFYVMLLATLGNILILKCLNYFLKSNFFIDLGYVFYLV